MGKKIMNLGSWQWPSCTHSKTQSFRANHIFKTINSIFLDPSNTDHHHHHHGVVEIETTPESWFTNSSESASFSTESEETGEPLMELIIKGVRSERLFFEPNCTSSSILEHQDQNQNQSQSEDQDQSQSQEKLKEIEEDDKEELPFKESVALALESEDPYLDFKKSMEEMVDTHEIKDWESLQELLQWYLKMNGKINHGFIIGAFVDLLIGFTPSNCDSITCYSSAASSFSAPSSPLSSIEEKGE